MATGWTDAVEQLILDHYTGRTTYTVPTWYLGASTTTPTETGGNFTEPSGNNYARIALTPATWNAATGGDPSSTSYGSPVTFAASTGGWGEIVAQGMFTNPTGGTVQAWSTLSSNPSIWTGDSLVIPRLQVYLGDPPDWAEAAGGFDPTSIAGCVSWYDGSDSATITESGGLISQWDDKAGSFHLLQATGANQPATGRTQNSLAVVDFTGNDYMDANGALNEAATTVFVVGAIDNTGVFNFFFDGTSGNRHTLFNNGDDWFVAQAGNVTGGTPDTSAHQFTCSFPGDSANTSLRIDGVLTAGPGNGGTQSLGTLRVGAEFGFFAYLNGFIGELIVYDSVLGTSDRDDVEAYLKDKWGTP
jgi:hypothetical protein